MSHEPSEKYKQFRNFMCNELGVTRQDIEAWTKESVANEVHKIIGQINVPKMCADKIAETVRSSLGTSYNSTALSRDIAAELAKSLKVVTAEC